MNKIVILSLILFTISCANRGYDSLSQEVPELFPGFQKNNYVKKETPKNIMYISKQLPENQKNKEEFYENEYNLNKNTKTYHYYVPKNRVPSSLSNNIEFIGWPKIQTKLLGIDEAVLID